MLNCNQGSPVNHDISPPLIATNIQLKTDLLVKITPEYSIYHYNDYYLKFCLANVKSVEQHYTDDVITCCPFGL